MFAPGHVQNSRKQLVAMGFYRDISMRNRTMCLKRVFFVHILFCHHADDYVTIKVDILVVKRDFN